jgi:hypothetical protein
MITKLLIIGFVLALIFALFSYWRLRPYINMARRVFGVFRDARRMSVKESPEPVRRAAEASERLVRCDACGTWTPAARAVRLRSSTYCSHECLELAATGNAREKRVGSK